MYAIADVTVVCVAYGAYDVDADHGAVAASPMLICRCQVYADSCAVLMFHACNCSIPAVACHYKPVIS